MAANTPPIRPPALATNSCGAALGRSTRITPTKPRATVATRLQGNGGSARSACDSGWRRSWWRSSRPWPIRKTAIQMLLMELNVAAVASGRWPME